MKSKITKSRMAFHLRDFLHSTSIHGLKYAADKDASWPERYINII